MTRALSRSRRPSPCRRGREAGRTALAWHGAAAFLLAIPWLATSVARSAESPGGIDFNRQVRPILSNHCFHCHGPDAAAREAGLRLDLPETEGGGAFAPGLPEESEALRRITAADPRDLMPPPRANKALDASQIAILRQWVAQGARYETHWSLVAPRPAEPPPAAGAWARNPIDRFVQERLAREGLAPAPEADPASLLRRLTLDLTGLPPSPEELDAFLAYPSESAYQSAVERLLGTVHHAERLALVWLDAARYADTNGYFGDAERQIWPWRDWVIEAYQDNLPYDRFTVEQLAGDLLPQATLAQRIATGFLRNSMSNNESGAIDEEFRVEAAAERLDTAGTVWMGLTLSCARCHDHKQDPVSQREYYQLFAYFNQSPEKGLVSQDDPPPVLDVATPEQEAELDALASARREAESGLAAAARDLSPAMSAWEGRALGELASPEEGLLLHLDFEGETPAAEERGYVAREESGLLGRAGVFDGMQHLEADAALPLGAGAPWSVGLWLKPSGSLSAVWSKIEPEGRRRGVEILWRKGRYQIHLVHRWGVAAIEAATREPGRVQEWQQLIVSYDGSGQASGLRVYLDGRPAPLAVARDSLSGAIDNAEPLRVGRRDSGLGYYGQLDELRLLDRAVDDEQARSWYWSDRVRGALAQGAGERDSRQEGYLLEYFIERHGEAPARAARDAAEEARRAEADFRRLLPKTLVMEELPRPRPTHVLARGEYDAPGEQVQPGVPEVLPPLPPGAPANRLGLARWLVAPEHPLTARVAVNRLWQMCFGEGLVRTPQDFGSQGEPPDHPELLDWLALRLAESGWDQREILRLIAGSATYRQSPAASAALLARDPGNRLLARGPRHRLSAELLRDQALAVSGLLSRRAGGPSVRPYQPPGLWEEVSYDGEASYQPSEGEGLWRRSLYTFWKRQAPPPLALTFDSPTREICSVARSSTNTSLQALALLNDVTFVEAGRALAALVLEMPGGDDARLGDAFRRVTARWPDAEERAILSRLLAGQRSRFAAAPEDARRFAAWGESPAGQSLDPVELAAWTATAHALLNLDETLNK